MPALFTSTYPAEGRLRAVEHAGDGGVVTYVCLDANRPAAVLLDLRRQRLGFGRLAGIVEYDREAVVSQALRDRRPNPTRGTGNDCDFIVALGHFRIPAL
jgi:hypothetical protein